MMHTGRREQRPPRPASGTRNEAKSGVVGEVTLPSGIRTGRRRILLICYGVLYLDKMEIYLIL